jgi:hypothetical protein
MSREAVLATVLWVLHTWTLDAFSTAPILNVTSPAKRCGKTRLLEILGMLVKRPLAASNITAAAVFRSIDKWAPTLLVDEADTFLPKNDELRGVLNSSHYRSGAFVVRVVGEQLEPKQFSTWCAKAIAGIGKLGADTLEDRSIRIPLSRKSKGDSVSRLVHAEAESRTEALRRKLARWSVDHIEDLRQRVGRSDPPTDLDDRQQDNWSPLLAIADLCGVRDEARKVAVAFGADRDDDTASVLLLEDMREIFDGREAVHTGEILEALLDREDRPWLEWKSGKPITGRGVARLLEPYGIRPKQLRLDGENRNGYTSDMFKEAFMRYLSSTTSTGQQAQQVTERNDRLQNEDCRGSQEPVTLSKQKVVDVVDDGTQDPGENKDYLPAARVLGKFGGRLQRFPLLAAIRRECKASLEDTELFLDLAVETGTVLKSEGWYLLPRPAAGAEGRLPLDAGGARTPLRKPYSPPTLTSLQAPRDLVERLIGSTETVTDPQPISDWKEFRRKA